MQLELILGEWKLLLKYFFKGPSCDCDSDKRGLKCPFKIKECTVFCKFLQFIKGTFKIVSKEVIGICLKIEEEQIKENTRF